MATDTTENYIARLMAGVTRSNDLSQSPQWIERNTSHPEDNQRRWSFAGHEYQIGILTDTAKTLDIQKCSQVGASEFSVRGALALLAMERNLTLIYVLPTSSFAKSFVKGRIDPVIASSKYLKSAVNRDVDSTEMKQIGTSFLYIKGTVGKSANISVPAQALYRDEVDFCDQEALKLFNSRLGHAGERELQRGFSTPTVAKYGINEGYLSGSQAHYCVKCHHCHQWVAPDFLTDVEIPGFDGLVANLEKEDLENPDVLIHQAFLRCPGCRTPMHWNNLCNPEMRQWIHKRPDVAHHSYQICPYDVPTVNTLGKTLSQLADYGTKKDWVNFKLGYPFEDAQTSFIDAVVLASRVGNPVYIPEMGSWKVGDKKPEPVMSGTYVGVDIGKTSWFIALKEHPKIAGRMAVVYAERIRQDGDDYLYNRVKYLEACLGAVNGVMDAGPDLSTSKKYCTAGEIGRQWACYYVRKGRDTLEILSVDEEEGIVKAARTECFNDLAGEVNAGRFEFCGGGEFELIRHHLAAFKRIDNIDDGEMISKWVNTGDDHYTHALGYAYIAYRLAKDILGKVKATVPVMPMMGGVKMDTGNSDSGKGQRTYRDLFKA